MTDAARIVRFWQSVETFNPRPLPQPDIREHVTDVRPGEPMPWEPGSRLAARQPAPGTVWRHEVFGGIFELRRVREALVMLYGDDDPAGEPARGQSALFACTIDADGTLAGEVVYSECAWALGQATTGGGDPLTWLEGRAADAAALIRELPDGPLTGADLRQRAADLAGLFGVTALLQPWDGLRVRSYQVPAGAGWSLPTGEPGWSLPTGEQSDNGPPSHVLGTRFGTDLDLVAAALRGLHGGPGAALAGFLGGGADVSRVDVRREPLVVRDGCAPDRIPPGRWVADGSLVVSEQFAVNEIMARLGDCGGLFAVHAPPGTGTTAVFSDLVAAVVVERARRLADLPGASAAFSGSQTWREHTITAPAPALTGFEIVLAGPDGAEAGIAGVGTRWRNRASEVDYFASTAQLACGDDAWALIAAQLGDRAEVRGFTERFWHGTVRGTDVLFRAGESIPATLRRLKDTAVDWPAAVDSFRAAQAKVNFLCSERTVAAAAIARLSSLEHALEETAGSLEAARDRCAELAAREPALAAAVVAAEERRRTAFAALTAHRLARPVLRTGLPVAVRAGRDWYASLGAPRAAAAAAERQRDAALREAQSLRASLATARREVAEATDEVVRLTAEMASLQAPVSQARQRWGDHVPYGPSQEETDDAALIERREKSSAWADDEYATARTELFLAALTLHKSLITAEAETFERNLDALLDMVSRDGRPAAASPAALAAWQSFFLLVPVVRTTLGGFGALFAGLSRGSLGWLLAERTGHIPPQHLLGALWRADRAVLAGDPLQAGPVGALPWYGQQALVKALEVNEEWAPGRTCAQRVADRLARHGTWLPAEAPDGSGRLWVAAPLRVDRQHDRPIVDMCNEIAYDGLLVCGTQDREAFPGSDAWFDVCSGVEGASSDALLSVLTSLRAVGVPGPRVRVVSMFWKAAADAARIYGAVLVFGEVAPEELRTRAGTVHAVRPGDVAVLMLGGAPARPDAHAFMADAPNLVNTAVGRARRRLYVIGDRKAWASQPYFEVLARRLPAWP